MSKPTNYTPAEFAKACETPAYLLEKEDTAMSKYGMSKGQLETIAEVHQFLLSHRQLGEAAHFDKMADDIEATISELAEALEGLKYGGDCWCVASTSDPRIGFHAHECNQARAALEKARVKA